VTTQNLNYLLKGIQQNLKEVPSHLFYDHDLSIWKRTLTDKNFRMQNPEIDLREIIKRDLEKKSFHAGFLNGDGGSFCLFAYKEIPDPETTPFGHFALIRCSLIHDQSQLHFYQDLSKIFDKHFSAFRKTINDYSRITLSKTHGIWSAYSIQGATEAGGGIANTYKSQHVLSYIDSDVNADPLLIDAAIKEILN